MGGEINKIDTFKQREQERKARLTNWEKRVNSGKLEKITWKTGKVVLKVGESRGGFTFRLETLENGKEAVVLELPDGMKHYSGFGEGYGFGFPKAENHWSSRRGYDKDGSATITFWKENYDGDK